MVLDQGRGVEVRSSPILMQENWEKIKQLFSKLIKKVPQEISETIFKIFENVQDSKISAR